MYKRGSIVLVPFPFSDLSGQKIRPALILSADTKSADDIFVFITSKIQIAKSALVSVAPTKNNGLKVSSGIVCNKIATLDKKTILGQIGSLDKKTLCEVEVKVAYALGL